MGLLLLIAFIATPLIEIALFIQVGSAIGLLATLATVVATAVIGTLLLRAQGLGVVSEIQSRLEAGEAPVEAVWRGALLIFAGALLLTPGFFTDAVGFALLAPPVQRAVGRFLARRLAASDNVHVHMSGMGPRSPRPKRSPRRDPREAAAGPVIEPQWRDVPDEASEQASGEPRDDSPWRREGPRGGKGVESS